VGGLGDHFGRDRESPAEMTSRIGGVVVPMTAAAFIAK
jgi:hypothetical protein